MTLVWAFSVWLSLILRSNMNTLPSAYTAPRISMLVEATNTINEVDGSADAGAIKRSANEGFASMHSSIGMRQCDEQATLRKRIKAVCWAVGFANITILIIAFFSFSSKPALLAIGFSVYGLGLRHAIDADHIAAIDNVTRKLVYENSKPVTLGLFFALGHSSIVILVAVVVGTAATSIDLFEDMQITSGKLSSGVSALFVCIRRRPSDCRMRAGTASSMMALREGQAAC